MMNNLSFLKKSKIGIGISTDYISFAELDKNVKGCSIKDIKSFGSDGCIKPSLTEQNIVNPELFRKTIKTVVGERKEAASVSIPDTAIKTALLEFESIPKKSGELEKLIRWKMEKSLPFPVEDAKMSYQIIKKDGTENINSILVSLIKKDVLYQYEELLKICGIEPVYLNGSSFHIFNLYHDFMMKDAEGGQNFIFLHYIDNTMSVMILKKGCPDFIRAKTLRIEKGDIKKIKSELLASLKFYSHSRDISALRYLYYFADTDIAANELIEDMKIKRLWIEQMQGDTGRFIKEGLSDEFTKYLPAIGAAMEIR